MKILILIVSLISIADNTFSQKVDSSSRRNANYLLVIKKGNRSSQKIFPGDGITVKLLDGQTVSGRVMFLSSQQIIISKSRTIDLPNIKWLRISKPKTTNLILGGILIAAGTALLIPVLKGNVDFDTIVPEGGLGILVIFSGIGVMIPAKHKLTKGDKLIYMSF